LQFFAHDIADVPAQAMHRVQADLAETMGWHHRALPWLRQLTAMRPLHEPLHARLIAGLAGTGRRAEACAVFNAIRRRLADELGTDPTGELVEAYCRMLNA
jgi:DNA-binding SARP family transcriptional activator